MSTTEEDEAYTSIEPFGAQVLHGATFRFAQMKKLPKAGRNGGTYDTPCILADIKGYVVPVWVELTRNDYDTLRLLKMQGIKVFTCTLGLPATKGAYAPRIFAGGKDW